MGSLTPVRALGVVGLGLIGSSIALAARRRWTGLHLVGLDRPEVLHRATGLPVDRLASDPAALRSCDLVVLALPVEAIVAEIHRFAAVLAPGAVLTDTAGTKRVVVRAAAGVASFVGGHPMAGAAGGAALARADLFDGCTWWLVPGAPAAHARVRAFVEALGAAPVDVEAARHDAWMAALSHLPQVVASALMALVGRAVHDEGLAGAGPGLRDTTRLAASPAASWAGLLASNADEIAPLLRALAADLDRLAGRLDDGSAVAALFDEARRWRAALDRAPRPHDT